MNLFDQIISLYHTLLPNIPQHVNGNSNVSSHSLLIYLRAHFDGAMKDGICACGVYINILED